MFDFLGIIASKIVSAVASVIIAVGIVSMPVAPEEAPIIPPQEETQVTSPDEEIDSTSAQIEELRQELLREKNERIKPDEIISTLMVVHFWHF